MDFADCDYDVQQVVPRSRAEKDILRDHDMIEKTRLAARREHFERHPLIDNVVKPEMTSALHIDDVDRFNRDYTKDQKAQKQDEYDRTWGRAAKKSQQQVEYQKSIELRRELEAAEQAKIDKVVSQHDFNRESVNYDLVTNIVPDESTQRGMTQRTMDTQREMLRTERARRIQHSTNSTQYNPITGEMRDFW